MTGLVTLEGGGLAASIVPLGAAIRDLRLDVHPFPLVLGFEDASDYRHGTSYFGATAGRYANRIAGGRFLIDGERHHVDTNFLGKHHLHGGSAGFDRREWTIREQTPASVTMVYLSERGEMGFPGALEATCTYSLLAGGRLLVCLEAQADAPTLCNLAHHSYFNLEDGGRTSALDHRLEISAGAYLPVDEEMIPTGHVVPVEGTPFDFRLSRTIREPGGQRYDHNWCLSPSRQDLRRAAWMQGPNSGVEMEVWTTEPGIQFYDGAHIAPEPAGLGQVVYGAHSGICLEPQIWPDSPNRGWFPQALLRPGETYRQVTEYRFRTA